MIRYALLLLVTLAIAGFAVAQDTGPRASAATSAVVFREPAYDLPHIYADTDLELVREVGREVAKDRMGQLIFLSRVGRGTLFQAFGVLLPSTFGDDVEVREDGYTSSELKLMFDKMPADVRALLLEYTKGVNDTIEEVYAGTREKGWNWYAPTREALGRWLVDAGFPAPRVALHWRPIGRLLAVAVKEAPARLPDGAGFSRPGSWLEGMV